MQLHPGSVFSSVTEPFRIRLLLLVWESYNRVSMSSALGLWPQLRKPYMRELSVDDQTQLLLERTAGEKSREHVKRRSYAPERFAFGLFKRVAAFTGRKLIMS